MSWQPVLCRNTELCSVCGILLNKQEPAVCSSFCSIWSQYVAPHCLGPEVTGGGARSPPRRETRVQPELLPQRHPATVGEQRGWVCFLNRRQLLCQRGDPSSVTFPGCPAVSPCLGRAGTTLLPRLWPTCGTSPKTSRAGALLCLQIQPFLIKVKHRSEGNE